MTVDRLSGRHSNPAFAHAVFLNVGSFGAIETNTHVTFQDLFIVVRALRIDAEAVWKFARHDPIIGQIPIDSDRKITTDLEIVVPLPGAVIVENLCPQCQRDSGLRTASQSKV